jgi:hypothetical protein
MLENILETLDGYVAAWQFDYMKQQTMIEKNRERYEYSYKAFKELVK